MDSIDTANSPTPNAPIWNTVLQYGGYCGGIMVAFSLLTYLMDLNVMSVSGMLTVYGSILVIGFVMAAIAMRYQRDQLDGGLLSYGKALGIGVLVILIAMVISSFWNYILVNFIDPEYISRLQDQFMETWGANMPEDAMEKALEGFEEAGNFITVLKNGLIGGTIFGLIIGLITAAFMKRDPKVDTMR